MCTHNCILRIGSYIYVYNNNFDHACLQLRRTYVVSGGGGGVNGPFKLNVQLHHWWIKWEQGANYQPTVQQFSNLTQRSYSTILWLFPHLKEIGCRICTLK